MKLAPSLLVLAIAGAVAPDAAAAVWQKARPDPKVPLYALTQTDGQTGLDEHIVNKSATSAADLFGGLITSVHIGGVTSYVKNPDGKTFKLDAAGNKIVKNAENSYPAINAILKDLGIKSSAIDPHNTHFHIYLAPPSPKEIGFGHNLLTDVSATTTDATPASDAVMQNDAQALLDYTQTVITGDELMFTMDVPAVPAQEVPIILAQAMPAGSTPQPDYILKDCQETENGGDPRSAMRAVDPGYMLANYLNSRSDKQVVFKLLDIKNITLLQGTTHGKLLQSTSNTTGRTTFHYDPTPNYAGKDKAIFMAEFEGKRYKIVLELHVFMDVAPGDFGASTCPEPTLIKVNGNPVSGSAGDAPTTTSDLSSWLSMAQLDGAMADASGITVAVADLPGSAVGQTTGTSITLDTNAAGNGWFIDTTPADNSEFLPTSNPNEWIAKEGSAAYGKMDMLSVLLHEYGHALGIEHSADSGDYMGATLTPGVRRLPSADELALMQQLLAQAKGDVVAGTGGGLVGNAPNDNPIPLDLPLGGSLIGFAGLVGRRYTQYEAAANPAFSGLDAANGWNTQGSVDIAASTFDPSTGSGRTASATLNEVSASQTRLNQVFMLGSNDRYLTFTLSGSALNYVKGAPEDAFQVALLDASTGASLLGSDGQTRTDAFLSLQADGTQNAASGVTFTVNPDGSRTYRVDLTNVPKGIAVNLSFDLIGFGANDSHVTVSDVRTSGLLQLQDASANVPEDGTLAFDPFAQVDNAAVLALGSHVVDQPAHGSVSVNADGTFVYTPAADYFGGDSFSYRLSDGALESNLATVSITLTAVNDAPVVADVQASTAEDTPVVIALGAYVSDVDSTPSLARGGGEGFAVQVVTGPAHGVLTQNADGSYTYTPEANYNGTDSFTYKANDGELDSNLATVMLNIAAVNDAPTGADNTVTTLEDTPYVFQVSDFGFSDAQDAVAPAQAGAQSDQTLDSGLRRNDGSNNFASVIIGNLPTAGSLTLNGQAVVSGQSISATDIAAGWLQLTPALNANGNAYAAFTFRVQDDGGVANGGMDTDQTTRTMTLDVTAVNDAPTGADNTVTTLEDTPYVFQVSDFGFSDANDAVGAQASRLHADGTSALPGNDFAAVIISNLPQTGSLTLNGTAVTSGQSIAATDIAAGWLQLTPALNANGNAYAAFTFRVQDDGGVANGGVDTDQTTRTMTIDVTAVNDAPVATDMQAAGYEDTPLTLNLLAGVTDVDSTVLTPAIIAGPQHGQLAQIEWNQTSIDVKANGRRLPLQADLT